MKFCAGRFRDIGRVQVMFINVLLDRVCLGGVGVVRWVL